MTTGSTVITTIVFDEKEGPSRILENAAKIGKALEEILKKAPTVHGKKAWIAGSPEWILAAEHAAHHLGCSLERLYVLPFDNEELNEYLEALRDKQKIDQTLRKIGKKKLITWR